MDNKKARYDIKGLADELEVGMDSIALLFTSFFSEMENEIKNLEEYLGEKDWHMLERVIHNIKGVSANLNVYDVFEEAAIFDEMLKKNQVEDARKFVDKIIFLINDAKKEVEEIFKQNGLSL